MTAMGGKRSLTLSGLEAHPSPMLKVHSPPVIEPDPQHVWQLVFWLGEAFDYDTPFRETLDEVVGILQPSETVKLELPPYAPDEDFVEGFLVVGAVTFKTYYEYSLGYLALMSGDREALEAVAAKVLPMVYVGSA
jgi:hypothetical protein